MIPSMLETAKQWFIDLWAGLWSPILDGWPLYWSWGVFILIVLGLVAAGVLIRLFLPSDWAKLPLLTLFVGVLSAVAWLFGRITMHTEMQKRLDAERARKVRAQPKEPEPWKPWPW